MKKLFKIILTCLIISIAVTVIVFLLMQAGVLVFDRSADISLERVVWQGKEYSVTNGDYTEGRTIAKGKDGNAVIKSVKEDPSHTFIVARSFLDQTLLVSDNYTIPTSGKLTTVSWNGTYITDSSFLDAVSKIDAQKNTSFTYETEGIFILNDNQHMRSLYFAYDNCPVTTNFKGYMGKINGQWVITTYISQDTRNEDGSPKPYSVDYYLIPEDYWDVLSQFFS